MKFGEKLKELRIEQGLSQREVGERLNVSQQTIAQYERACFPPKAQTMERLASALGISSKEFWIKTSTDPVKEEALIKEVNKEVDKLIASNRFSLDPAIILPLVKKLNDAGLSKVYSYVSDLLKIPEYKKEDKTQQNSTDVLAAHARTDVEQTQEGVQHDLDIMNDDSMWD